MFATRAGCGCMLSGIAAASTSVLSSTVATPGPICMPASGLPLVAIVTLPFFSTRLIVAVLPSRRYLTVAPSGSVADPVRYTPDVIRKGSKFTTNRVKAERPDARRRQRVSEIRDGWRALPMRRDRPKAM